MKLKLGIITKDRTFRNHINNQLISIENIEMIAYKSYEIYDILLLITIMQKISMNPSFVRIIIKKLQ